MVGTHTLTRQELLERESQLAEIALALEAASSRQGRLVVIEAAAGLGKTSLLEAALEGARECGLVTLHARGSELERGFAFGVVRQLFEPLLGRAGGQGELFAGAAGQARQLFEEIEVDRLESVEDQLYSVLYGLYWLTSNLCRDDALLLAVDDAHWCDVASLRFLAFLLRRIEDLPVVLVIGSRSPEPTADATVLPQISSAAEAHRIELLPLSEAAVGRLVGRALGAPPHAGFARACREATAGNPFLLRELVRALRAEGIAPTQEQVQRVQDVVPETVMRVTLARLGRLPASARSLAEALAVLGDRVPLRHAATLAKLSRSDASQAADVLAEAGTLESGRPLSFVHPLVRAAIAADMAGGRRAEAHRAAAGLLREDGAAADVVSLHLLLTDPEGDPLVLETLREASRLALGNGSAEAAVSFLRRALIEPPPPETRLLVLRDLAYAELHVGDIGAATANLEQAVKLASEGLRAALTAELGAIMAMGGRFNEAVAYFERSIALSGDSFPLERESRFYPMAAVGSRESRRWVRQRLESVPDDLRGQTVGERRTLAIKAGLELGSAARAASFAERAIADGGLPVEQVADVAGTWYAMSGALRADRYDLAERVASQAVKEARQKRLTSALAPALSIRAFALYAKGALREAEADARTGLDISRAYGRQLALPPGIAALVAILVERGELAEGEEVLAEAGFDGEIPGELFFQHVLIARGRLRLSEGHTAEAATDLLKVAHVKGLAAPMLATRPWAVLALARVGQSEQARELALTELEAARAWGARAPLGAALRACANLERGERAIDLLQEACSALAASPARLEYARTLVDWGAAQRRTNRRTSAREPLRKGLEIAERCGAAALAARARDELRATGARPRRELVTGVDALTGSEARIARMAAEGRTNREIAQALFVTIKTVEMHLSNAYRKLDIGSRSELPTKLAIEHTRPTE